MNTEYFRPQLFLKGSMDKKKFTGVPCVIGRNGIEEIIELKLTEEENKLFSDSCDVIREYIKTAETN